MIMGTLQIFFKTDLLLSAAVFLIVFLNSSFIGILAQDSTKSTFKNLQSLTYEEMKEMEMNSFENDELDNLNILVNIHLKKAKAEKNALETAHAYYYKYVLSNSENALDYSDSIIEITLGSSSPDYPALGYSLKGYHYYNSGKFDLALDSYLKAYQLASNKNNVEQQREISLAIAAIRNLNGQHYAAYELYNKALNLLKKEKNYKKKFYSNYIILLYNLSLTHLRLKEVDSARFYTAQGMELTSLNYDDQNMRDFVLLDAQINYYDNNFQTARDTLEKYVNSLDGTSKAIKLYYLGKIEDQLKNKDKSIKYFEKIDSIVSFTQDEFPEVKDVYHHLILDAIQKNNKEKQIGYIDKLIYFDSILSAGQEHILNKSTVALDIPLLKQQKLKVQEQLRAKKRYKILAGILGGIVIISGLHFYMRNRRMERKLQLLMEEEPKSNRFSTKNSLEHIAAIPEDIRNDLLSKLDKFEKNAGFLNKNLDMSTLAYDLETNTTYLSLVINNYIGKSFPNYVKELRISYAVKELKSNIELTKYNYQGLAELFGFKTGESFSKSFYKKTGVYPSKFIAELKARKEGGYL